MGELCSTHGVDEKYAPLDSNFSQMNQGSSLAFHFSEVSSNLLLTLPRSVKLTTHLHLVPRSRMRGTIPPLPPHSHRFHNIHSNIILHLRIDLPDGPFPSGFPTKIVHTFHISPMRSTCPAHVGCEINYSFQM
jgi:hypothetical protein